MPELSFRPTSSLKPKITSQLWGRVKLSNFMELPEDEFCRLIRQLETQSLFKRLNTPIDPQEKIISRQRFPHTDFASRFYQIKEKITPDNKTPDLTPLLEKKQEIIPLVRKIGLDNFKQYFLYTEDNLSTATIARFCDITSNEVKTIRELMDEFCILDLTHPTRVSPAAASVSPGVKIAAIEKEVGADPKQVSFKIGYFSPHYARGRYVINYKRLFNLKDRDRFPKDEFKKIARLIRNIELINSRHTILYQIIKSVMEIQTSYFRTGQEKDLKPLTQQMLARRLKVHRSTINRAINHKYLETPWGEEKYLKSFLMNQKGFVKKILTQIVNDSAVPSEPARGVLLRAPEVKPKRAVSFGTELTDGTIKNILEQRYHIKLARRTICAYRHELNKISS